MNIQQIIFLALGGGVARGAFHLGVLDFCEQYNIDIKAYSNNQLEPLLVHLMPQRVSAKEQLKIFFI